MPEFHGTIEDFKAGVEATGIEGVLPDVRCPRAKVLRANNIKVAIGGRCYVSLIAHYRITLGPPASFGDQRPISVSHQQLDRFPILTGKVRNGA
jgi:hypothetical protein